MMTLSWKSQHTYMNFCGDNIVASKVVHLAGQGAVANIKEAPAAGMTHFLWLGCANDHMVYLQGTLDQDLLLVARLTQRPLQLMLGAHWKMPLLYLFLPLLGSNYLQHVHKARQHLMLQASWLAKLPPLAVSLP